MSPFREHLNHLAVGDGVGALGVGVTLTQFEAGLRVAIAMLTLITIIINLARMFRPRGPRWPVDHDGGDE